MFFIAIFQMVEIRLNDIYKFYSLLLLGSF